MELLFIREVMKQIRIEAINLNFTCNSSWADHKYFPVVILFDVEIKSLFSVTLQCEWNWFEFSRKWDIHPPPPFLIRASIMTMNTILSNRNIMTINAIFTVFKKKIVHVTFLFYFMNPLFFPRCAETDNEGTYTIEYWPKKVLLVPYFTYNFWYLLIILLMLLINAVGTDNYW